jgi:hypothetical protein
VIRIPLAACPGCARHIRVNEPACPFCRAELPSSFRQVQAPPPPAKRLGRAALYALRASALSATAAACGGQFSAAEADKDSGPVESSSIGDAARGGPPGTGSEDDSGQGDDASMMGSSAMSSAADGAPSLGNDAAVGAGDAGVGVDSSVPVDAHAAEDARAEDARTRTDAAAPVDANAEDAFTVVAAYGAPIFIDAGRGEQDAHFVVLYGAPPIHR